jgi:hypothetical protein
MNQGFGIEPSAGSLVISASRFYRTGQPVQTPAPYLYESLSKELLNRKLGVIAAVIVYMSLFFG